MTKRISRKHVLSGVAGMVAGGVLTASAVGATGVLKQSSGSVTKFDAAQVASSQDSLNPDNVCTQSPAYSDINGMTVNFTTVTDNKPSIVNFNAQSAYAQADTTLPEYAYVRLVVDGQVQAGAGTEKMVASIYGYPENNWQFITDELPAGDHTATLQWRIVPGADMASSYCIKDSSMIVMHD